MLYYFDYKNTCWWCGNPADSREHKYKRTDLIREFGPGPYKKENELTRIANGKEYKILGPNSNEVKFENSLCQNCNNKKSQPFDRVYDIFMEYIKQHEHEIISTEQFVFSDIFGHQWRQYRENLIKYYVKHICCRLASAKVFIKPEIVEYLNGNSALHYMSFYVEKSDKIITLIRHLEQGGSQAGNLWIGNLHCILNTTHQTMRQIKSFLGYRWLLINYLYDETISQSQDNFSTDVVRLSPEYPPEFDWHTDITLAI